MNVDRVNNIMLSAIHVFQANEIESLRSGDETLEGLEATVGQMAREISEESGRPIGQVIDVVSDVLGKAAAQRFAAEGVPENEMEKKLVEWMTSGGATILAQQVVEQLQTAS